MSVPDSAILVTVGSRQSAVGPDRAMYSTATRLAHVRQAARTVSTLDAFVTVNSGMASPQGVRKDYQDGKGHT